MASSQLQQGGWREARPGPQGASPYPGGPWWLPSVTLCDPGWTAWIIQVTWHTGDAFRTLILEARIKRHHVG